MQEMPNVTTLIVIHAKFKNPFKYLQKLLNMYQKLDSQDISGFLILGIVLMGIKLKSETTTMKLFMMKY